MKKPPIPTYIGQRPTAHKNTGLFVIVSIVLLAGIVTGVLIYQTRKNADTQSS